LKARLRYRVVGGALAMWIDLHRPHKVIEDAFTNIIGGVADSLDGMRLVHGKVG
jgi:hypothetical protein